MTTAVHIEIVQAFLERAYDKDFRKVLTPAVAASISRLCEVANEHERMLKDADNQRS